MFGWYRRYRVIVVQHAEVGAPRPDVVGSEGWISGLFHWEWPARCGRRGIRNCSLMLTAELLMIAYAVPFTSSFTNGAFGFDKSAGCSP